MEIHYRDSLGTFVASGLGTRLSYAVAMTFNLGVYNFSSGMISYFLREVMLLCILQKSNCLTARCRGLPFDSSDNAQHHISSGKLQPHHRIIPPVVKLYVFTAHGGCKQKELDRLHAH